MGAHSEKSQVPAKKKSDFDVLVQEVAVSAIPGRSARGGFCYEVASPLQGTNGLHQASKAEGALAPAETDSEEETMVREKNPSLFPEPRDAWRLPSISLSDDERSPPAYHLPSSSQSQFRSTIKASLPSRMVQIWEENRSCIFVVISGLFASAMALFTKKLELGGSGLHPVQILFMRMVVTTIGCMAYLWWKRIPHSLLGAKSIRWLLLFRGFSGFVGIYTMWTAIREFPASGGWRFA